MKVITWIQVGRRPKAGDEGIMETHTDNKVPSHSESTTQHVLHSQVMVFFICIFF